MSSRLRGVRVLAVAAVLALGGLLAVAAPAGAEVIGSSASPIVNFHSGMCLGISGGDDDAPAVQWPCNGTPNQQWYGGNVNPDDPDAIQVVNADGECLGVAGGSTAELARVYGWSCQGPSAPNQYWEIGETGSICGSDTIAYTLVNYQTGYVVGVAANSTAEGAAVVMYPYQGECNNQQWHLDTSNFF